MSSRWFVVPVATNDRDLRYPKYTDRDGVERYSGSDINFSSEKWGGLNYPFIGSERFVVRLHGDTTTLDNIEAESDAYTIDTLGVSESEVAGILNRRFGESRSFTEWEQSLGVRR